MKKIFSFIISIMILFTSCDIFESLDVPNENQPNIDDLSTPAEFYSLLRNGYNTWYNGSIAASPTMAFACAELFQTGTAGWGSGDVWFRPRQTMFNDDHPDPVVVIGFGAWYNYYGSVGSAVKMSKMFKDPEFKISMGGVDYTNRARAHAYLIEALLYGNIALLYDKAYLYTEEHENPVTFDFVANTKSYKDVMAYAISKIDAAIKLLENDPLTAADPTSVIVGMTFDRESLLQFANSMGARFLACNARTQAENVQTDWAKVKAYAEKGLKSDFKVDYTDGWIGKVMTRDYGSNYFVQYNNDYFRVSHWLLHKMAPNDPGSTYPIPVEEGSDSFKDWPKITDCQDARLNSYFKYSSMRSSNYLGADRSSRPGYGTFILSQYRYERYYDAVLSRTKVDHYLKMENDTYLAEALLRTNGSKSEIAHLINNTRVNIGGLPLLTGAESYDELEDALFYERYVECDLVWPQLGFYDRRRNKDQMIEGTVRHFPIPGPELTKNGQPLYTFGGIGKEM